MNEHALRIPSLPPNDLEKLGDGALSKRYDAFAAEVSAHNTVVRESEVLFATLLTSDSVEFAEIQAAKKRLFAVASGAVSLASRREELRADVARVHVSFTTKAQKILTEVRERKTTELRQLCAGVLPWGWSDTVSAACLHEREVACWKPFLLAEQQDRPELAPCARTRDFLRDLVQRELGLGGNG